MSGRDTELYETITAMQRGYMELWGRTVLQSVEAATQQIQISFEILSAQTSRSVELIRKSQETFEAVWRSKETPFKYPDTFTRANNKN